MKELPLISKHHGGVVALVDDDDYEKVRVLRWYLGREANPTNWQAVTFTRKPKRTVTALHRMVMNATPGTYIDHIDNNGLNCQKSNLRFCTQSQNVARSRRFKKFSSKFRGVYWYTSGRGWRASVKKDGKKHFAPRIYESEVEAAKAYNILAKHYHGQFAVLNDVA